MEKTNDILITGGSGFIGTHLASALRIAGYNVYILDLLPPPELHENIYFLNADVTKKQEFTSAILSREWKAIFHFAAVVSVPECENRPDLSYATNLSATITALETLKGIKNENKTPPPFFFASSAAVYGDLCTRGQRLGETNTLPMPKSFYGLHKYSAEQSIRLYSTNCGLKALSFRFFNVYGPGQKASSPYSGVITKLTEAFRNDIPVKLYNFGQNSRDFVHVTDIAKACVGALSLEEADLNGDPVNLCTGEAIEIIEVLKQMQIEFKITRAPEMLPPRAGDIQYSCGDPTRAFTLLKWQARPFSLSNTTPKQPSDAQPF